MATVAGIDRVAPAAQQVWAELLLSSWIAPDTDQAAERFAELAKAAEASKYPPPIYVSLAELKLESGRLAEFKTLQEDLLTAIVKDYLKGSESIARSNAKAKSDGAVEDVLEQGIPRLLARSNDASDRCLLLALQCDPGYLPALEKLAGSEDTSSRTFALAQMRRLDSRNALSWFLEASLLIGEERFDEALVLIERGGRCPHLQSYPAELPHDFQPLAFGAKFAEAVREKYGDIRPDQLRITPVVLSNLRHRTAALYSFFHQDLSHAARRFEYWALAQIELAQQCGNTGRILQLKNAMRSFGRLLLGHQPQDGLSIVGGIYLIDASLGQRASTGESAESKQARLDLGVLRRGWRENYHQIAEMKPNSDGLPPWLAGEVNLDVLMDRAASDSIASSGIMAALDQLAESERRRIAESIGPASCLSLVPEGCRQLPCQPGLTDPCQTSRRQLRLQRRR